MIRPETPVEQQAREFKRMCQPTMTREECVEGWRFWGSGYYVAVTRQEQDAVVLVCRSDWSWRGLMVVDTPPETPQEALAFARERGL